MTTRGARGPSAGAKPDEHALWRAVVAGQLPRDAGRRLGIHRKRVTYICEKWALRRIYNYGVSADLGWVEVGGRTVPVDLAEAFREIQQLTDRLIGGAR